MTTNEIINKGAFFANTDSPRFELNLYLPFFDQDVKILALNLLGLKNEPEMNLITDIINELLDFPLENITWLKREIYNHYNMCISNISYNMVSNEGYKNEIEANKGYFKIFNEEDSYKNAQLEMIWFDVSFLDFKYFNLKYKCSWEKEHGIKIGVMNGEFESIE